jgi:hypothetical protein
VPAVVVVKPQMQMINQRTNDAERIMNLKNSLFYEVKQIHEEKVKEKDNSMNEKEKEHHLMIEIIKETDKNNSEFTEMDSYMTPPILFDD